MAYFLFVDESGQDQQESPCEVLAGVAIRDNTLWPFIRKIHHAELDCFGMRYSAGARELKASKLLKRKVFRHAALATFASEAERRDLAKEVLERGSGAVPREYAALAQCKLEFTRRLLRLCTEHRCTLFASIIPKQAPRSAIADFLRKDYSYLFERFFYFLDDKRAVHPAGIIVFDELEKSRSHILIGQMDFYFKNTRRGIERSELVIPEPFFVHSDLSSGIQIADIMAYLLSWGYYKTPGATTPARPELEEFAKVAAALAYTKAKPQKVSGLTVIRDLRPASEKG
ncbi:MAG: DUF3800 domain-containing protein [Elusimicrobiota bacterium]|jgi:hypothetical protein